MIVFEGLFFSERRIFHDNSHFKVELDILVPDRHAVIGVVVSEPLSRKTGVSGSTSIYKLIDPTEATTGTGILCSVN